MSELREDPISGDWVIIAPGRALRPSFLDAKKARRVIAPRSQCPFEHPEKNGNWPPLASYPNEKHWKAIVIPNKYPALQHEKTCSVLSHNGIYAMRTGVGEHDLVITRDHNKNFAQLSPSAALEVLTLFQTRAKVAAKDPCLVYFVPFLNFGSKAGASVGHPHYQILTLPIVPGHAARSLADARAYNKKHHACARCVMIKEEERAKVRIVAENRHALAIAPYASKMPFEVRIMPKTHEPYFYKTPKATMRDVVGLLQSVMKRLKTHVNDPDFNFFIHEAPLDGKDHRYHHWHIEVFPRVTTQAGFEFSTGVYINVVTPEFAAAILRGQSKAQRHYY